MSKGGKKLSKNNAANRGEGAAKRMYEGKAVIPIKIVSGNTTMIGAKFEQGGGIVKDKLGKAIPYGMIS